MTRPERVAQIAALQAEGMTSREIAASIGLSYSTVRNYISDPDGTKDRDRKRSYGGTCQVCGAPTDGSNGAASAPRFCIHCLPREPRKWPAERIIAAIQQWARDHGEPPAMKDWDPWAASVTLGDEDRGRRARRLIKAGVIPWMTTAVERFGSWNAAIMAAGFKGRAPHGGGGNQSHRRNRRAA